MFKIVQMVRVAPGIERQTGRYLQNHVIEPDPARRPVFDGFSECWFEDVAAYDTMNAAPEWDEINEDAVTLFDRDWIVGGWSAALEEHVVVGGCDDCSAACPPVTAG